MYFNGVFRRVLGGGGLFIIKLFAGALRAFSRIESVLRALLFFFCGTSSICFGNGENKSVLRLINSDACTAVAFMVGEGSHAITTARIASARFSDSPSILAFREEGGSIAVYRATLVGQPDSDSDLSVVKIESLSDFKSIELYKTPPKSGSACILPEFAPIDSYAEISKLFPSFSFSDSANRAIERAKDEVSRAEKTVMGAKNPLPESRAALEFAKRRLAEVIADEYRKFFNSLELPMRLISGNSKFCVPSFRNGKIERVSVGTNWGLDGNSHVKILRGEFNISDGNEGGPVLDSAGRLIGVKLDNPKSESRSAVLHADHVSDMLQIAGLLSDSDIGGDGELPEEIGGERFFAKIVRVWRDISKSVGDFLRAKFVSDYLFAAIMTLASLFVAGLIWIFLAKNGRRKIPTKTLLSEISSAQRSRNMYVPSRVINFVSNDINVKFLNIDGVVRKIEGIVANGKYPDDIDIYGLAKEYVELQSNAIKRLSKCSMLIKKGNSASAMQLATSYPSLIEIVNTLQFDGLPKWAEYCRRAGIPVPERISDDDISLLNSALVEMRAHPDNSAAEIRHLMAAGKLRKVIDILEKRAMSNPLDTALVSQLLSIKRAYMESEITRISAFAQRGDHRRAVEAYNDLLGLIPHELKKSSSRWAKMQAYVSEIRRGWAKKALESLSEDLRNTGRGDWRGVFEIISEMKSHLEEFPDLKYVLDTVYIEGRRNDAVESKKFESEKEEFERTCRMLSTFVRQTNSVLAAGGYSARILKGHLTQGARIHKIIEDSKFQLDDRISDDYERCVSDVNSALRRLAFARIVGAVLFGLACCGILGAIAYAYCGRISKLKAYGEFLALDSGKFSSATIDRRLGELLGKYPHYIELKEFSDIVESIRGKSERAKRIEEELEDFTKSISSQNLESFESLGSSDFVKKRSDRVLERCQLFRKDLPRELVPRLEAAKSAFDAAEAAYARVRKAEIEGKRAAAAEKASSALRKLRQMKAEAKFDSKLQGEIVAAVSDYKSWADPYVSPPSAAEIAALTAMANEASQLSAVAAKREKLLDSLKNSKNLDQYFSVLGSISNFYKENGINKVPDIASVSSIIDAKESFIAACSESLASGSKIFAEYLRSGNMAADETSLKKDSELFLSALSGIFSERLANIFSCDYAVYNEAPSPLYSVRIYTIFKPAEEKLSVDFKNYKGRRISECYDSTFTYAPLSQFFAETIVESKITARTVCLSDNGGGEVVRKGEFLSNFSLTHESAFVANLRKEIETHANNREKIFGVNESFGLLQNIAVADSVPDNFKLFALRSIILAMKTYNPKGSGYIYSPSIMGVFEALVGDPMENRVFMPFSWHKDFSIIVEELKKIENEYAAGKLPESSFNEAVKLVDADALIVKADENGKIPEKLRGSGDKLYFYVNSESKVIYGSDSDSVSAKPWSCMIIKNLSETVVPPGRFLSALNVLQMGCESFIAEARLCSFALSELAKGVYSLAAYADSGGRLPADFSPKKGYSYMAIKDNKTFILSDFAGAKVSPFSPIIEIPGEDIFMRKCAETLKIKDDSLVKRIGAFLFKNAP